MDADRIEAYWESYLRTLPADSPEREERYEAEAWGDSPGLADGLGASIADGTKTATCSALWEYEADGSPLPRIGAKVVVLGGYGDPLCIVETTEVEVRPYDEIDAGSPARKGKVIARWSTGERSTGAFSRAPCRISAKNRRRTCRWFASDSA